MKIENITNINDAMEKLWEYDQDHQKINFPRDKPNYEKFRESIIKEYNEEPKGFFFVYEDNNIIGYLRLITRFNPYRQQKFGDVRFIHLDPLNRGKGYGTKLLKFADEYFKKNGCHSASAGVSAFNEHSNLLFKKLGYQTTRITLEKYY